MAGLRGSQLTGNASRNDNQVGILEGLLATIVLGKVTGDFL